MSIAMPSRMPLYQWKAANNLQALLSHMDALFLDLPSQVLCETGLLIDKSCSSTGLAYVCVLKFQSNMRQDYF